jgi:hypothetical protein
MARCPQPYWQMMNHRATAEILSRQRRSDFRDFLCLITGRCQRIAEGIGKRILFFADCAEISDLRLARL